MPQLFGIHGTTRGKFSETSARGVSPQDRELSDLTGRVLLSQIEQPPKLNIPTPLSQGISGLEDLLPSLFAHAAGPTSGLAGLLSGGGGGAAPTFGRTQTREELGLQDPTMDPAGFLPPKSEVAGALPGVHVPPNILRERRLQGRLSNLEGRESARSAAGKPTKGLEQRIGRVKGRLDRAVNDPRFL